jgi:hypothetical protein
MPDRVPAPELSREWLLKTARNALATATRKRQLADICRELAEEKERLASASEMTARLCLADLAVMLPAGPLDYDAALRLLDELEKEGTDG